MKPLRTYIVPFTGLKLGKHHFDYEVDDQFFEAFEYSIVKSAKVNVELELDKQETLMILDFKVKGHVKLDCDKCLSDFNYPLEVKERQLVKFAEDNLESDDEDIVMLSRKEVELDLSTMIYELITVSLPFIKNCTDGGEGQQCDPVMLSKLNDLSIGSKPIDEAEEVSDPRWEALNKLKK